MIGIETFGCIINLLPGVKNWVDHVEQAGRELNFEKDLALENDVEKNADDTEQSDACEK